MMDELKEILRTTVGKIMAAIVTALAAALGVVQTGVLETDVEALNPVPVVEQPVDQ